MTITGGGGGGGGLTSSFCAENLLMIENVSTQLTVFHCLCPLPASRKGLRLPKLRSALFGEGGSDWRPWYRND